MCVFHIFLYRLKHGQRQPGCPSGAGKAEGKDPGGSGADLQHAGD